MNPLPNRPLMNNPSAPLSLPNVPSFDQIAYNGRPRKVLPEAGKEYSIVNGVAPLAGSNPVALQTPSAAPQVPIGERNNVGMSQQQSSLNHNIPPPSTNQTPVATSTPLPEKEREPESDNRQSTAIFRPDDAGEWKEKLRLANEAAEKAKLARESSTSESSTPWDRRIEDGEDMKDEEVEPEDEESSLVGDGEGTKIWKAKRTLRKLVFFS